MQPKIEEVEWYGGFSVCDGIVTERKSAKLEAALLPAQQPMTEVEALRAELQAHYAATSAQYESIIDAIRTPRSCLREAGDLILKALDVPYAREIAERLKRTIPTTTFKGKPNEPA